jgi:diguanylate cyclase (GGDEF)-like protein/PAS domain S-box-containing protein
MSTSTPDPFASFFFTDTSDLFVVFNVHGVILHFNDAWRTKAGFCNKSLQEYSLFNLVHFDSSEEFAMQLSACRNDMHGKTFSIQMRVADDQFVWYSCYVCYNPATSLYYALLHNITEQVVATQRMIQREERLKILVENVNEYLYSVQFRNGAFVDTFHNKQCEKITGYTAEEFTDQPDLWYTMIHKDDRQLVIDNLEAIKKNKKSFYIEHRIIHKTGAVRWISNSCVAVANEFEQKYQYIGFILDITEKKSKEYELYDHATLDALTGIYNRWAGLKALNRSIVKAFRSGAPCTVCYFDINNLKEVNDTMGHFHGDELIKTAVSIIQHELRSSDIFFRMGGDEFVLIFTNTMLDDSQNIVHRIIAATEAFNAQEGRTFKIYISYGFSEYVPQKSSTFVTAEQLIEEADKSMYSSKEKSRGVFKSVMAE